MKHFWLKITVCCVLLVLAGIDQLSGDWHAALPWPWNGLTGIGSAMLAAFSGFFLVYLLVTVQKK